eukprot:gene19651-35609_t
MSTQSEEIIEIDKTVNVTKIEHAKVPDVPDKLKYEPFFCASVCYGCCGWFQNKCECCAKTYPNGKNSKGRYGFPESKCLIDCVNLKYTQITTSQGDGQLKLVTEGAACCSGCIWCCGVCKDVGPQKRCDNCCAALSPDCDPETKFASELRGAGSCDKCSLECCCCATACCCCMECCFVEDRASGKEGAKAWTEKVYDHSEETIKTDDPFDIVAVTKMNFVMKSGLQNFEFIWRIQSVGETETDLQYQLAKEYVGTCQDPTSTARTVANVIHFLNSV